MLFPVVNRSLAARDFFLPVGLLVFCAVSAIPAFAQAPPSDPNQQSAPAAAPAKPADQAPAAAPQQSPAPPAPQEPAPEMSTRESSPPLRVPVNLVLVRVVVRDSHGNPVGGLKNEDFQLLDSKKPVPISHFSADTLESLQARVVRPDPLPGEPASTTPTEKLVLPSRFVAFLFDDTRLKFDELIRGRKAADDYVTGSNVASDRFAIVTISGQNQLDFTDDRAKIHDALMAVRPRAVGAVDTTGENACPPVSYYQAYLAEIQNDADAINVAAADALACAYSNNTQFNAAAQGLAASTLMTIFNAGDSETVFALRRLDEMVRRLTATPGQRNIIFISGGFIYPTREQEFAELLDRAARANVVISSLDARGLYVVMPGGDISNTSVGTTATIGFHANFNVLEQSEQSNVLEELADGTGGGYFHNNNDLEGGFKKLATAPAFSYLLGFSPLKATYDGKYHNLKVTLTGKEKYDIQARRGYFMPKHGTDPAEAAKQEVEEELFSQEEIRDLPIDLHTQFYKLDANDAKLAVMAHVDVGRMRFRKADGRNENNLTLVAAIFDRNGNFITGTTKTVEMKFLDQTLAKLEHTGMNIRTNFDVRPGSYVVRLVARDSEAAMLTAANGMVEIPQ
jgi:VWFA-related protein